jgi:hypothetical protein
MVNYKLCTIVLEKSMSLPDVLFRDSLFESLVVKRQIAIDKIVRISGSYIYCDCLLLTKHASKLSASCTSKEHCKFHQ